MLLPVCLLIRTVAVFYGPFTIEPNFVFYHLLILLMMLIHRSVTLRTNFGSELFQISFLSIQFDENVKHHRIRDLAVKPQHDHCALRVW